MDAAWWWEEDQRSIPPPSPPPRLGSGGCVFVRVWNFPWLEAPALGSESRWSGLCRPLPLPAVPPFHHSRRVCNVMPSPVPSAVGEEALFCRLRPACERTRRSRLEASHLLPTSGCRRVVYVVNVIVPLHCTDSAAKQSVRSVWAPHRDSSTAAMILRRNPPPSLLHPFSIHRLRTCCVLHPAAHLPSPEKEKKKKKKPSSSLSLSRAVELRVA